MTLKLCIIQHFGVMEVWKSVIAERQEQEDVEAKSSIKLQIK